MKNYRFSLSLKNYYSNVKSHWFNQDNKMNEYILDKIRFDGHYNQKILNLKKTLKMVGMIGNQQKKL